MTKAERLHLVRVKSLPCGLCGASAPSSAHHIREGQGMAQRAGHFCTIPLCYDCHQGPQGIHGDRTLWRIYRKDEITILDETHAALWAEVAA